MSIFSDFQDSVVQPLVADYAAVTAIDNSKATTASPTGNVSTMGLPNLNPSIFGTTPQSKMLVLAVIGIAIFLLIKRFK